MFTEEDANIPLKAERTLPPNYNRNEIQYLRLVEEVLSKGKLRPTRAKVNGENISAYTLFGRQLRFDLQEGFPLLTTKKMSFHNILHELLWLLKGSDNIGYLRENNVHIWDSWVDVNDNVGQGSYPNLWRHFPYLYLTKDFEGFSWRDKNNLGSVDQIRELIEDIQLLKEDPSASCGRRLIVTAWHPFYSKQRCELPSCHCFIQFDVDDDRLSCQLYQRSADVLLGAPYNIASYALLTHIIAYFTGLLPGEFIHTFGNVHVYQNHTDQLKEQLRRSTYKAPSVSMRLGITDIDSLTSDDFKLVDYKCHPAIKGQVAV